MDKKSRLNNEDQGNRGSRRTTNQIKTIVFGANQIPGFCWFILEILDYVGEETGDQDDRLCGFRSPVSYG